MKKSIETWCKIPEETLEIDGVDVAVVGLPASKLFELTAGSKQGIEQSFTLICACCKVNGGAQLDIDFVRKVRPGVFKLLSEAVARVNGLTPGNLSATADDDSYSA